jgi:hypothetical protein
MSNGWNILHSTVPNRFAARGKGQYELLFDKPCVSRLDIDSRNVHIRNISARHVSGVGAFIFRCISRHHVELTEVPNNPLPHLSFHFDSYRTSDHHATPSSNPGRPTRRGTPCAAPPPQQVPPPPHFLDRRRTSRLSTIAPTIERTPPSHPQCPIPPHSQTI